MRKRGRERSDEQGSVYEERERLLRWGWVREKTREIEGGSESTERAGKESQRARERE